MSLTAESVLEPQSYRVTRADLVAYAKASGDHNVIHQDEAAALAVGLPGVIAHGMFTLALAGRAVKAWTQAGDSVSELVEGVEIVEFGGKFTSMVVVPVEGTAVDITGRVTNVENGLATIFIDVTCQGTKVLGGTKAVVRLGG